MLILTRKVGARNAFVFRAAVNPSLDAADKTSCFVRPAKQTSSRFWCAPRFSILVIAAPRRDTGESR
jgi:hypothetical protein